MTDSFPAAARTGSQVLLRCLSVLGAVLSLTSGNLRAQGTEWSEATVGSEWDVYARALAVTGLLSDEPWALRPFSPPVLGRWQASLSTRHPWADRLSPADSSDGHIRWLRPSVQLSDNTGFAWGFNDGPVWQGRGVNAWVTVGAAWHSGHFSARLDPLFEYAQNAAFRLEPVPNYARNPYVNPIAPTTIDAPQRMGPGAYRRVAPGNSYFRYDVAAFGIGLSTEELFWGPGVRNALIFGPNAGGFPHLVFGTNRAVPTPIGRFSLRVVYGQLQQSAFHPPAKAPRRLGGGMIAAWQPPGAPITIGLARFYHRFWPTHWTKSDFTLPIGAFFSNPQENGQSGIDNQLASVFFAVRSTSIGLDVYGEFGKNDRNLDLRDLLVKPENASAWLLGFFKVAGFNSSRNSFWTIRTEVGNGRIGATDQMESVHSVFYQHAPITPGHTELGQLLGTPLIERSGGIDLSVDRYTTAGRLGLAIFERQMPPDRDLGMPPDQLRSQWDVGFGGVVFHGRSDINFKVGYVWDLNRFPGKTIGNAYLQLGARLSLPGTS